VTTLPAANIPDASSSASQAMRRVTLRGAEPEGFEPTAPASYLKLIFQEAGQLEPTRPLPEGPRPVC